MSEKSRGDIFIGTPSPKGKPKGLVDALSEIQQYYVVERSGSPIPEDFFTIGGKLSFFEVGFRASFLSGIISALLMPFAFGVVEKHIPIFGSHDPSLFDRIFALVLSISFSIAHAVFIAFVGKYYIGSISKSAIRSLLQGFITGALVKMVAVFIFFHTVYFYLLSPSFLSKNLLKFRQFIKYETLNKIYHFLLEFRPVFLTSSYFLVFATILMIAIPVSSIIVGSRKTKREIEKEKKWA